MKISNIAIDRVNLRIEKVTPTEFDLILSRLSEEKLTKGKISHVRYIEKLTGVADYRHNVYIELSDYTNDGNIYIGYKNNSAKLGNYYDMKIEFNPNKHSKAHDVVNSILRTVINDKSVRLVEYDIAIDVPYNIQDIYALTLKGREVSTCVDTLYFGKMHSDGYLKIYNKQKEIQDRANKVAKKIAKENKCSLKDVVLPAEYEPLNGELTRIEFTCRPNDKEGYGYRKMLDHTVRYNRLYNIGSLTGIDDFWIRATILAIKGQNNTLELKDVPKQYQAAIRQYLKEYDQKIDIDDVINSNHQSMMEDIKQWFFKSSELNELELIFGKGSEREVTDDEQALFDEFMSFNDKKGHKKSLTLAGN